MHRTTFENYVSLKVKAMQVYLKIRKRAEDNYKLFSLIKVDAINKS